MRKRMIFDTDNAPYISALTSCCDPVWISHPVAFLLIQLYSATARPEVASQMDNAGKS